MYIYIYKPIAHDSRLSRCELFVAPQQSHMRLTCRARLICQKACLHSLVAVMTIYTERETL